ncbi:hypothetical protein IX327_001827 [Porphyromonas levii]|nr:hypothetical protein [Porphyromonas levii]
MDGIAPLYVCGSHSNVVIMDCMLMEDRIAFEDEVRSLYNQPRIKNIECNILKLYQECERRNDRRERNGFAIRQLLNIRKYFLEEDFQLNEVSRQLLVEFNSALKTQLEEMWKQTIALGEKAVYRSPFPDTEAIGKCFLGYNYSRIHPVQTVRAKKMWDILNGCLATFEPLYDDGVTHCVRVCSSGDGLEYHSCNQVLYLGEEVYNWNEGLDEEYTKDLHLIYAFHNLWEHMHFSIFDLLWVRDFSVELFVESCYTTYSGEYDDLDWSKYDFYN